MGHYIEPEKGQFLIGIIGHRLDRDLKDCRLHHDNMMQFKALMGGPGEAAVRQLTSFHRQALEYLEIYEEGLHVWHGDSMSDVLLRELARLEDVATLTRQLHLELLDALEDWRVAEEFSGPQLQKTGDPDPAQKSHHPDRQASEFEIHRTYEATH